MYPVYPTRPPTVQPPAQAGLHGDVLHAAKARLARLDPRLDPASPRGRMAILVMAATTVGRNVDRLARITRIERETVAKFCRRLFDADIDPVETGTEHRDFWNVVGVAEGRLARRVNDAGAVEWVPVGAAPRVAENDWPAPAGRTRHDDRAAADEDEDPWARRRTWGGVPADTGVPAVRASAVLFPGAEWLT